MPVLNRPQQLSRGAIPNNNSAPLNTSTEQRLAALIARTGYKIIQENGQRKYFLPNYTGPKPAKGCEIFVGKLPRDLLEDEIVPIFEEMGTIIEVRLMVEFSGLNRGYCFVLYQTVEAAQKAVRELDNYEIRKGKYVGVVRSVDNRRLFIGGIPRNKTREEVLDEVSKLVEGVVNVILYPSAGNKEKNRGFAFIEFLAHRDAAMARRKLIPGRAQLWNSNIAVDWAEPEQEVDESTMSTVKIVYLRNLMITTTEERLREIFEAWKPGCIERVKKLKDYAFVHFFQRSDAMDAISAMNGREIDGATVEACLAKPPDKSLMKFVKSAQKLAPVLGAPGNIHQNLVAAATQLYRQNIHGNHTMLPNMGPVGLPDIYNGELPAGFGANGFDAFGNHGNFAGRQVRSAAGLQSAGVRQAVAAMVRDALNPKPGKRYSEAAIQFPPMDMQPAPIAFIPVPTAGPLNLLTQKPVKSFVELLDLYCKYLRWGEPQYELHSVAAKDVSGQNVNAYVYKVMIPGFLQVGSFQDTKPSTSVEEAKELAAQYTMLRLGIPLTSEEDIRAVLYQEMMADAAASNAVRLFPFASDDRIHAQECLSGFYSQQQERDQYDWLRSAERYENCHMSSLHQRQLIYDRAPNAYTAAAYTEISTQSSFKVPPQAKHYSPYSNYNLDVSCGSLSSGFGSLASTGNGSSGFSSLTSSPVGASAPSQSLSGQFYEERMHAGGSGFSKGHAEGVTGCRYPGINLPNSNGTTHLHHSLNKNDVSFEKNQAIMQLIHRLAALNTGHSLAGAGNNKATATSSNAVLAAPMAGEMFVSAAGPATVGPGANMISGGQAVCPQFGFIPQYYQPTVWTQGMMNIPTSGPAVQPKVSAPNGVPAADGAVNLPVTVGQPGTAYAEPANATTAIVVSSN